MLLDMCDCVGTGNDGEQRRQRVWAGVELVGRGVGGCVGGSVHTTALSG